MSKPNSSSGECAVRAARRTVTLEKPRNSGLVLYHTKAEKFSQYGLIKQVRRNRKANNSSIKYAYRRKIITYGNTIELYTFSETQFLPDESLRTSYEKNNSNKRRLDSIYRTRREVLRIIQANTDYYPTHPVFITLTFADNIKNIKQANYEFKKFIQRLNYKYKIQSKYIAVIEFQKRGAVHYHVVFFNLPYITSLTKFEKQTWGNGFTKVESPRNINDVTKYVGKYMSKELLDKRLVGQKAYFTSRGIQRPQIIYNESYIDNLLSSARLKLTDEFITSNYSIKKFRNGN
jgi:hypothetical protein